MKKKIQSLGQLFGTIRTEGSFAQNSAWMFSSSGISIVIQMIFFVILARIYPPEVYGLFGVLNVYLGVLGNSATLGYNQAFVLPKTNKQFSALLKLTLLVATSICVAAFLITLLFGEKILAFFHHEAIGNWMYCIAPLSLLMALDRVVCDWAIRNKEFKKQMIWSTTTTLCAKVFNVFYGLRVAPTVAGLVITTGLQYALRVVAYIQFCSFRF